MNFKRNGRKQRNKTINEIKNYYKIGQGDILSIITWNNPVKFILEMQFNGKKQKRIRDKTEVF